MAKYKKPSTLFQPSFKAITTFIFVIGLVTAIVLYRQERVYQVSKASAPVLRVEQTVQGGASEKATVTTKGEIVAAPDSLYIAAVSTKPYREVKAIDGLGLSWSKVQAQCGARSTTGVEIWMATGSPTSGGAVTATLAKEVANGAIAVSRFAGVDLNNPVSNATGYNTKGATGPCEGGKDSDKYSFTIPTAANSFSYGAVAQRLRAHEPQSGFSEVTEFTQGDENGDKAGLVILTKQVASAGQLNFAGQLSSDTDWAAAVVSINGFAGGTVGTPTPQPTSLPTVVPTGSPKPTTTPVPTRTPNPTPTPTPVSTGTPGPVPSVPPTSPSLGIWTSKAELASKPMSGPAWDEVLSAANGLSENAIPNLDDQDSNVNVDTLAAAIVYARTGNEAYKTKVVKILQKVEVFQPKGRTLAWGRETGAYAMAADLVGYRTPQFEQKMRDMAEKYICSERGTTLLVMFKERPNNWGAMAFGSLAAIYRYLGDTQKLKEIHDYYVQNVEGPKPAMTNYDKGDMSWHCKASDPRLINPRNCVVSCGGSLVNIEGVIPDDMRRGASCSANPTYTNYPWGQLEGLTMAGRVLERAGMPIWSAGDAAICRAAAVLQEGRFGKKWRAEGDDQWQLPILDKACGKNWKGTADPNDNAYGAGLWQHGKNAGWGYVL